MVTVYSQYRKHYKDPLWDDFAISEYNRKKDYRIGRRSVEHRHQPLHWDSSGSDVDTEGAIANKDVQISDIPDKSRDIFPKTIVEEGSNKACKPSAHVKQELISGLDNDKRLNKKITAQTSQRQHSKHRKSKRSKTRGKRNNKDNGQGLFTDKQQVNGRVPFVAYGWANHAPLGKKFTHNVKANPQDVYPASLRALKRREVDIAKRLAESKNKTHHLEYDETTKEKFFNLSHLSPMFMTEYQSSYCNLAGDKTGYVW